MKYLKVFDEHADYLTYANNFNTLIKPSVSYCKDVKDLHFDYRTCLYGQVISTSTTSPTKFLTVPTTVKDIEIDGVLQPKTHGTVITQKIFSTIGLPHEIKYILKDGITTIDSNMFSNTDLQGISIPDNITAIYNMAFAGCSQLLYINCRCKTAPSISNMTFMGVKTNGVLYVPDENTGYDAWLSSDNFYLGLYNWRME